MTHTRAAMLGHRTGLYVLFGAGITELEAALGTEQTMHAAYATSRS